MSVQHACLSPEHFLVAVPVAVVAAVGGFLVSQYLNRRCCKKGQVNTSISKDSPKVVHSFDMEDIGTKAVYCRCWKTKKVGPQAAINVPQLKLQGTVSKLAGNLISGGPKVLSVLQVQVRIWTLDTC